MTSNEKTPVIVPASEAWTKMSPKDQYLEQQLAEDEAYGFVVPTGELDD